MGRKFIYLINPVSGTSGKARVLETINKKTSEQQVPFEILHTNAAGDYHYLQKKIADEKVTDIIVCGGDGTVNQVAGALLGIPVNIGIIPMGSGNGLALAAKIPRDPAKALDVIFKGNAFLIDSFLINNRFSCMLCGLGFDAQVAHDFARQKKRGFATYFRQTVKNFFKAKTYPFGLLMNGTLFNTKAYFISIANSNQFGNNFTIAPRASLQDGLLDIVVVNKMSKLRMVWSVMKHIRYGQVRLYEDKKYHSRDIHYFHAKALSIQNPELAPLHIDGDPAETAALLEIGIIEKAFALIMP
jgi:diacylglycerol kinase (ATP)